MSKQRLIEMYVGTHYGDTSGSWHTTDIYVDASLEKEDAIAQAEEAAYKAYEGHDGFIAFISLCCYWDDDMMEEMEDFDDEEE